METKHFMNVVTGRVDTEQNWLEESKSWDVTDDEMIERLESLVEIKQDEKEEWIEIWKN